MPEENKHGSAGDLDNRVLRYAREHGCNITDNKILIPLDKAGQFEVGLAITPDFSLCVYTLRGGSYVFGRKLAYSFNIKNTVVFANRASAMELRAPAPEDNAIAFLSLLFSSSQHSILAANVDVTRNLDYFGPSEMCLRIAEILPEKEGQELLNRKRQDLPEKMQALQAFSSSELPERDDIAKQLETKLGGYNR